MEEYFVLIVFGYLDNEIYRVTEKEVLESLVYPSPVEIKLAIQAHRSRYARVEKRYRLLEV